MWRARAVLHGRRPLTGVYDDFEVKLDRVHPRHDQTLALPLFDKDGDPV
jgi:hypothetical protein